MSKRRYTTNEIEGAFRILREQLAAEFGVKTAEGADYKIRDIERDVIDILTRNERQPAAPAKPKGVALQDLAKADLDSFNDFLFG